MIFEVQSWFALQSLLLPQTTIFCEGMGVCEGRGEGMLC